MIMSQHVINVSPKVSIEMQYAARIYVSGLRFGACYLVSCNDATNMPAAAAAAAAAADTCARAATSARLLHAGSSSS
jgi:hypothetical protein